MQAEAGNHSIATVVAMLDREFPGRVDTGEAVRRQHANTLTWIACEPPDVVVWPLSADEVVRIVRLAGEHRIPVIAFGAGTSLEGHVNAPAGGISLDLSRMDRIVAVNPLDLDCTVEAGVTRRMLNAHLRDTGLFFAVDPGADTATLGGMAATRASGTNAVRYGTMRENVVALTAVLADGTVVRTGGRARKSAAGFDLARLLVGSEGTLGIITEITVRLHPVPASIAAAVAPFRTLAGACDAAVAAVTSGLGLARVELLDALQIRAVNAHSKLGLDEAPTLFVEFHGNAEATRADATAFEALAREHGAIQFARAEAEAGRRRLWAARHDAFWAVRTTWPGKMVMVTDVCVPLSRLSACLGETADDIAHSGLVAPIVGHVGDGNFHVIPVFDPTDGGERQTIEGFLERLALRAIAMDGTCTGEHGVGQGKMRYLRREHGAGVDAMRKIKQALDPLNILNPNKIIEF